MSTQCEPWPLLPECLPPEWSADPSDWSPSQLHSVELASGLLTRYTAGQYGLCRVKIRPCRVKSCSSWSALNGGQLGAWMTPVLYDGLLYNIPCGCRGTCSCSAVCEMPLEPSVHDIIEVKLDGLVVPNTAYRVDSRRLLVRTDGQCWPECQQLGMPDTALGTWSVTYRRGNPPDRGGELANTLLALEFEKACQGDSSCKLPPRVTSVVRNGLTYDIPTDLSAFESSRTGIPRVDMWLAAVNPFAARSQMRAYSPDTVRSRTTSWPVEALPPMPPTPPDDGYRYVQNTPITVWTIVHNLGFYPAGVRVEDSDGEDTIGEVSYPDINTVRIDFNQPVAGVAYLS